jgi:hypothetical protein
MYIKILIPKIIAEDFLKSRVGEKVFSAVEKKKHKD